MDTTEKAYYDVKDQAGQDAALYSYMYKRDGAVVIDNMCVAFTANDEKNIQRLRERARMDGFMFWAESEEGKRWMKENGKAIAAAFVQRHTRNKTPRSSPTFVGVDVAPKTISPKEMRRLELEARDREDYETAAKWRDKLKQKE